MIYSEKALKPALSKLKNSVTNYLDFLSYDLHLGRSTLTFDLANLELRVEGNYGTLLIPLRGKKNSRLRQELNSYMETYSKNSSSG